MNGSGGKYETICSAALMAAQAKGCFMLIIDGSLGSGYSVEGTANVLQSLPDMLRKIAANMDKDLQTADFTVTVQT